MASLVGCAAPPADEGASESGQAESSNAGVSTAFAIDYGVSDSAAGVLVASGLFDTIPSDTLLVVVAG